MANVYNINNLTYIPSENPEWFAGAVLGSRLIRDGYITPLTGIKGGELLSVIALQGKILQGDNLSCAWTPQQILKLSDKLATVKPYKINLEQCIDELEQKRTIHQLSPGATNTELPAELEAATLRLLELELAKEVEGMIIGAKVSDNPALFDGVEQVLATNPNSVKVKTAAITVNNALTQVESVYNAIPDAVLNSGDENAAALIILVSHATKRKILSALGAVDSETVAKPWSISGTGPNARIYYLDTEIVPAVGIGINTIIAYAIGNVTFNTDLTSDLESIELGQFPAPMNNKVFIKGRLFLGVNVLFEDETVIGRPDLTSSNGASKLEVVGGSFVAFNSNEDDPVVLKITKPAGSTLILEKIPSDTEFGMTLADSANPTLTVTPINVTGGKPPFGIARIKVADTTDQTDVPIYQNVSTDYYNPNDTEDDGEGDEGE